MFERFNQTWGKFIAEYPKIHIIVSLTIVTIFAIQLKNIQIENDIRTSFSPLNSKSSYEYAVYKEFFNLSVFPERSSILFSAKDYGSMLRLNHLQDVLKLDALFMNILRETDPNTGLQNCNPQCNLNLPFYLVTKELIDLYTMESNSTQVASNKTDFLLDYPITNYYGTKIFIGINLIDVLVSSHIFSNNRSKIYAVKTIILWYFARADSASSKKRLTDASMELFKSGKEGKMLKYVDFEIFGDGIANSEMVRGAVEATVLMTIGFGLLFLFIFISINQKLRELKRLKVFVVICVSILCPLISSAMAFGILISINYSIYTIMCVSPFLICGIGVDDAFIMLQSWQHYSNIKNKKRRLCVVMMHVGPSIAITSLTNTTAFGIGYATPTPQMSLFCLCTSMAVFFDYLLTFTLLAPVVLIMTPDKSLETAIKASKSSKKIEVDVDFIESSEKQSKYVKNYENCYLPLNQKKSYNKDTIDLMTKNYIDNELKRVSSWILTYTDFLISTPGRIIAIFTLISLLIFSSFGIIRMKSTFEPSKAFPSNSQLSKSLLKIRTVFDEFFPINIIVNRPPNVSDINDYNNFYKMVEELEALPETYDSNRTLLWLRNYEAFDREIYKLWSFIGFFISNENYTMDFKNLDYFLQKLNYPAEIKTEVDSEGNSVLKAFQFTIIAKNMSEWLNRAIIEQKCREILIRYSKYNATIYDGDSAVLNLLLTAKIDLIGSIIVTIACMIVICSFFIPHIIGVTVISLTIASICYMLVGMISWWGADLDPVTIVDVLLATGFSVDYTAHVAHHFYVLNNASPRTRIALALNGTLIPTLEASFSTVLCMLPLIFVPTYAIVAFAKTIFVVVATGLLHGIFLMPVFLCFLPHKKTNSQSFPLKLCLRKLKNNSLNVKHKESLTFICNNQEHLLKNSALINVPSTATSATILLNNKQ